ncbi:hypothetical protein ADU20_27190 [Burkholderia pseudomallei]|uniref:hypothetical protein n=1 Tax=Burkholderia pseudomallei TaxID=28450 RepID=UPI00067FB69D|nr:hypothetical protein [Burkholderia pseudomallei]KNA31016.1 hypothetical protein ADU20_27190 [Burkholderia pseudomallei]
METLREGWTTYEREVIPEGFSDSSREVVQHAFYHGAIALMMIGNTYRRLGLNETERQAVLERVIDEIVEFDAGCQVKVLLHVLANVTR